MLYKGTHKGSAFGIAATGKMVSFTSVHFFRVENGLLVGYWGISDDFSLFVELGLISPSLVVLPVVATLHVKTCKVATTPVFSYFRSYR